MSNATQHGMKTERRLVGSREKRTHTHFQPAALLMKYSRRTCKLPSAAVNTVLTLRVSYVPLSFIRQSCRIQTKRSKRKTQEKKKRVLRRPRRKSRTDTSHKSMKYLVYKKKKEEGKTAIGFSCPTLAETDYAALPTPRASASSNSTSRARAPPRAASVAAPSSVAPQYPPAASL